MNTIPYESREEDWDRYDDEMDETLPGRPHRNYLNKWSALLFALIVGGVGFYIGIRVEKNQVSSAPSGTSGLAAAFASRFGSGGTGATGAAGGTSSTAAGGSSTTTASGASGFAGRFGGGFGGFGGLGGSSTVGTISSIAGNTFYVQETSGNTVKVTVSSATKFTKSETVSKGKVYPGDTVVIAGPAAKNGTVTATSVTDSGTRSTGSGTTGTGSSSTSGSGGVSSLF